MSPQNSNRTPDVPDLLKGVRDHYEAKIARHGATPEGVDWSSLDKQRRRFDALASCITATGRFSVLDVGCGYGALLDYLRERHRQFDYVGVDISDAMITHALASHERQDECAFRVGGIPEETYDYVLASGIFNVMGQTPRKVW